MKNQLIYEGKYSTKNWWIGEWLVVLILPASGFKEF